MGRVDDYPTAVKNYCRKNGIGLQEDEQLVEPCLLYTSPSPRD